MDSEEGERGVGHRVDEPPHEVAALGSQHEVVAAKRHDPRLGRRPAERGEPVRVRSRAHDDTPCLDVPGVRPDERGGATTLEGGDLAPEEHVSPSGADVVGERARDRREVDHGSLRRMERAEASDVRLELAEALALDDRDVRNAVCKRAPVELLESRQLCLRRRDDDLAAPQHGDSTLVAEVEQPCRTGDAEPRLERARRVVDAAVDDAAGTAGLVRGDGRFLVQDRDPCLRPSQPQLPGDRQPQDPGADDGNVVSRVAHEPSGQRVLGA